MYETVCSLAFLQKNKARQFDDVTINRKRRSTEEGGVTTLIGEKECQTGQEEKEEELDHRQGRAYQNSLSQPLTSSGGSSSSGL